MGHQRYCISLLVSLIFTLVAAQPLSQKKERVNELINHDLTYLLKLPTDSVIKWEKELADNCIGTKDHDNYFTLKCTAVFAHILKGKNTEALECARKMQEKAELWDSDRGRAIAFLAVGYTFVNSGVEEEGMKVLAMALKYFENLPNGHDRISVLEIYVPGLCKTERMEEAKQYLGEMKQYFEKNPKQSPFRYLLCLSDYQLHNGQLKEAGENLKRCTTLSDTQFPFYQYLLWSAETDYYMHTREYNRALQLLDSCSNYLADNQSSWQQSNLLRKRIAILAGTGQKEEAVKKYQQLFEMLDAQKATYYTRLVSSISTNYNASRMEVNNQERRNQTILLYVTGILLLVVVSILLMFHLKNANRKLKQHRLLLEEARKKAEDSMLNKSLFLSNMTHDIRTPLNALTGFSELLVEGEWDEVTRDQFSDLIQRNSNLLLKLINDVVDLSNLKTGKLEFRFAAYDAVKLCQNVVETIEQVKQTEAKIVFITTLSHLEIVTDEIRMQQLLINLLTNATKFTPQGTITLRLEMQNKDTALFSVTDTGCGINIEQQEIIFDRFEKANEQSAGFGIGLSICKLIVDRIGGKIWVDADYHEGARFLVTHPLCLQNPPTA